MKQMLILSGKGGTGKTTIASAFIKLADAKADADCDVDAPNLHLITNRNAHPEKADYYGLPKAKIHLKLCTECDQSTVKAINNGQTIVDIDCISRTAVKEVYHKAMNLILEKGGG